MKQIQQLLITVGFLSALPGCSGESGLEGPPRYAISGTVTLDGQPVDGGTISFLPAKSEFRPSGGPIVAGKFDVQQSMGPNEGLHRVEIHWWKPNGRKYLDPDTGEMKDEVAEVIPDRYHLNSELSADVTEVSTSFTFDLQSK